MGAFHGLFRAGEDIPNCLFKHFSTPVGGGLQIRLKIKELVLGNEIPGTVPTNRLEDFVGKLGMADVKHRTSQFNVAKMARTFTNAVATGAAALTRLNSA